MTQTRSGITPTSCRKAHTESVITQTRGGIKPIKCGITTTRYGITQARDETMQ